MTCTDCGGTFPLHLLVHFDDALLCEACRDRRCDRPTAPARERRAAVQRRYRVAHADQIAERQRARRQGTAS